VFANRGLTISAIELFIKVKDDFTGTHNEYTLKLTLAAGAVAAASGNAQLPDFLPRVPWNALLPMAKGFNHSRLIAEHHKRSLSCRELAPGRAFGMSPRRGATLDTGHFP
jgi:hypothetical protein